MIKASTVQKLSSMSLEMFGICNKALLSHCLDFLVLLSTPDFNLCPCSLRDGRRGEGEGMGWVDRAV